MVGLSVQRIADIMNEPKKQTLTCEIEAAQAADALMYLKAYSHDLKLRPGGYAVEERIVIELLITMLESAKPRYPFARLMEIMDRTEEQKAMRCMGCVAMGYSDHPHPSTSGLLRACALLAAERGR